MTDYFYDSLQQVGSVKVQRHAARDEIWICYSDGNSATDYNRIGSTGYLQMNRALDL